MMRLSAPLLIVFLIAGCAQGADGPLTSSSSDSFPSGPQTDANARFRSIYSVYARAGTALKNGNGTEAVSLFSKVAQLSDDEPAGIRLYRAYSRMILGNIFDEGRAGVSVDYNEAIRWYSMVPDYGSMRIGEMYAVGRGVPKDLKIARAWMVKAGDGAYSHAAANWVYLYDRNALPPGDGLPTAVDNPRLLAMRSADIARNAAIEQQRLASEQAEAAAAAKREADQAAQLEENARIEKVRRYESLSPAERLHADPID